MLVVVAVAKQSEKAEEAAEGFEVASLSLHGYLDLRPPGWVEERRSEAEMGVWPLHTPSGASRAPM